MRRQTRTDTDFHRRARTGGAERNSFLWMWCRWTWSRNRPCQKQEVASELADAEYGSQGDGQKKKLAKKPTREQEKDQVAKSLDPAAAHRNHCHGAKGDEIKGYDGKHRRVLEEGIPIQRSSPEQVVGVVSQESQIQREALRIQAPGCLLKSPEDVRG